MAAESCHLFLCFVKITTNYFTAGTKFQTDEGKKPIEVKKGDATVYNFTVKDFHTYFDSNLGIWTHNKC
ncbi:polymorphic toxin-type HINT domain-containing protein [Paenibacillus terrae]